MNTPNGNGSHAVSSARRTELAAFLRTRRERIGPEDVGLPAGTRRRTSGLRREELAQLAGVGVTWYTWLEQGRPINASVQVLDAVSRTLRLDATEREHLFRLADLPGAAGVPGCDDCPLPPEVQQILDALPLPASVVTERFDLLAWNRVYAALFPRVTSAPPDERNTLLSMLTGPPCCCPVDDQQAHCDAMIAQLRAAYGRHVGDPAWTHFIRRLEAQSPVFATAWAAHDVAKPGSVVKVFRHPGVGEITAASTSFAVQAVPGARMAVYTPVDEPSRKALARLAAGEEADARFACWPIHHPERAVAPVAAGRI
ncbi:helix-turn-helix transcriptional regulator [Trebonia sp.]|uniref:helix-turn-helix transcriptional regulator n=1 Tax=Trebonia sp. TaxID=2767075 RepID=UPI00260CAD8B|nr:helix-turn-helix transcriptional regulator [Trebonia sp.]